MGLFEWGEKRFARGVAGAMIHSYKLLKKDDPALSEMDLVKLALSTRPGKPAKELFTEMEDPNFWQRIAGENFARVIWILVRVEYIERMRGTLETESEKTNAVFKSVIAEEMQKAGL